MRFKLLTILTAASVALAAPILEARQSYGTTWKDQYIPKPLNFQIRPAGAACDFQLVYERFFADNRYDVYYQAEYQDGSSVQLNALAGGLAKGNSWYTGGYPDNRAVQAVFFSDICKNGAAPRSFRVNFALRQGYTYNNRWTTGSFTASSGSLPAAPQGVVIRPGSGPSTITWNPVSGATSYVVVLEYTYPISEVGPIPQVISSEVIGGASTSFAYNRKINKAAVVALAGGTISAGAKQFTPLDEISDVYPAV